MAVEEDFTGAEGVQMVATEVEVEPSVAVEKRGIELASSVVAGSI